MQERARMKPQIARQMHNISKLELPLCMEAVDALEAVLYGIPQTASSPPQSAVIRHAPAPRIAPKSWPKLPVRLSRKNIIAISAAALVILIAVASGRGGAPQTASSDSSGEFRYETNGFEYALQWLAVEIACLGKYSSAQPGDYTLQDPHDYYTPELISTYLADKSGKRTMTKMIYGVCFDYAQLCWDELLESKEYYQDLGMTDWWMICVDDDPNVLTVCDPTNDSQKASVVSNGVFLKTIRTERVRAHGDATRHAWIWIKDKTGKIYWIDPTWTDNTGRVVWGYVDNGREIELPPAQDLCVQS
jgi:hypothetical protein